MGWWGLDEAVRRGCVGGWALGAALACPGGLGGACAEEGDALGERRQACESLASEGRQLDTEGSTLPPGGPEPLLELQKRLGISVRLADQTWAMSLSPQDCVFKVCQH